MASRRYTRSMSKNEKPGLFARLPRIVERALSKKDRSAVAPELEPLLPEPGPSGLPPAPPRVRGPGAKHAPAARLQPSPGELSGPSGLPAAPLRVVKRGL